MGGNVKAAARRSESVSAPNNAEKKAGVGTASISTNASITPEKAAARREDKKVKQ